MKKYLLIILLFSYSQSFCQTPQQRDSLKIDSLKKILPSLNGQSRIDCMILLVEYYGDADTIVHYSKMILDESKTLGYKKGIAMGLLTTKMNPYNEANIKEAIKIGEETGNDEVLGRAYGLLTQVTKDFKESEAYYIKAINHYHKAGKFEAEAGWCNWLSQSYMVFGQYEKAFDYAKRSNDLLKNMHSSDFANAYSWAAIWSLWNMSQLYSTAGDYENALGYMKRANHIHKIDNGNTQWGGFTLDISSIFTQIGKYDSALLYWNRMRNEPNWAYTGWRPGKKLDYNYLAKIYIGTRQYDKAIEILKDNNVYFDSLIKYTSGNYNNAGKYGKMIASFSLAEAYDSTNSYRTALEYAKGGFRLAEENSRSSEMMQGYKILSTVYHHLGNNDSAYSYLVKYNMLKDSMLNKQFLLRIYNARKEADEEIKTSQINFLNKENELKKSELKQQGFIKNSLAAGLVLLILLSFFIFRNQSLKRKNERFRLQKEMELQQIENEKKQSEFQKQVIELEMQALRAQMNPHFIFNCLSSINRFIFKNDNQAASDYLTKFSRLIRMVLIHSQKRFIPLEDELEMLRLYLDMERLRFKNEFDYSITTKNTIDAGAIFIPPLLLQPFCENAIWHGLMHREGRGHLSICITEEERILYCSIADNGVGREKAAQLRSKSAEKEKSLGLKITSARLALLNGEMNNETSYKIEDVLDKAGIVSGTKVDLKIKYKETAEELKHA